MQVRFLLWKFDSRHGGDCFDGMFCGFDLAITTARWFVGQGAVLLFPFGWALLYNRATQGAPPMSTHPRSSLKRGELETLVESTGSKLVFGHLWFFHVISIGSPWLSAIESCKTA